MDTETNPNNPASDLKTTPIDAPMYFWFEIQLITNEFVGKPIEKNRISVTWHCKRQHVRGYLIDYYEKHAVLPAGCHDLGNTKSRNIKIGVIDFDSIRQKIRADNGKKKYLNFESSEEIDAFAGYPIHREIEIGMREQAMGRDQNEAIFNLRQKLGGRWKKFYKN